MAMFYHAGGGLLKGHCKKPTDNPDWAINGAPDNASMIAATKVQQALLKNQHHIDFVEYVMDAYGETREQAEIIVRNCQDRSGDEPQ